MDKLIQIPVDTKQTVPEEPIIPRTRRQILVYRQRGRLRMLISMIGVLKRMFRI